MFFPLPRTATAPFCPSEVKGSVAVPQELPFFRKLMRYAGPGLLVSVGYMDPGNWATDIEAGSRFGYGLLFVVLLASLAAMLLQTLCVRLGLVARKDLARACREHYSPRVNRFLWLGAELAIVACDLAEVLGSALALHLLFGVSIPVGIAITAFDTLLVLGLQGAGFRRVEAIVLGLVGTIAGCFAVELMMAPPNWFGVAMGFAPSLERLHQPGALYLAIGIVGATVMPHNLYLHSSIVQTRLVADTEPARREAVRFCTLDAVVSLSLALLAAFVWDALLEHFSKPENGGYRCVAPNLRGFEQSSAPAEVAAYRAKHLVQDIAALIALESPQAPLAALVAHDWGGAVAWNLAASQPQLMKKLVIINSPHPGTFLRELQHSPSQQAASAYMNFLIRPDAEK
eukprot:gene42564-56574_t